MTITSITLQTKNTDRVNLFVDGEFYASVSAVLAYKFRLEVGMEIDKAQLDKVLLDSDKDKAFDYALTYISKYTPTEKILKNKLFEKGYGNIVVRHVVDKCKSYGYINDEEYARSYVALNGNIKGKARLKMELRSKGVDESYIAKALDGMPDSNACEELAKKHSKNQDLHDPKYRAKLIRFLQYRGYEWEDISQALATLRLVEED